MSRSVRRVFRGVARGVDAVTGDILDLDQSKLEDQIKAQQKAQEEAYQRAEDAKKAEEEYQNQISAERDKLNQNESINADKTGVGLSDVKVDFTKQLNQEKDEDDLKKLLSRV